MNDVSNINYECGNIVMDLPMDLVPSRPTLSWNFESPGPGTSVRDVRRSRVIRMTHGLRSTCWSPRSIFPVTRSYDEDRNIAGFGRSRA